MSWAPFHVLRAGVQREGKGKEGEIAGVRNGEVMARREGKGGRTEDMLGGPRRPRHAAALFPRHVFSRAQEELLAFITG